MGRQSKDLAWISHAMMDSTLIKGFDTDLIERDKPYALDLMQRQRRGLTTPQDRFPKQFYLNTQRSLTKLPDLFMGGGFG